MPARSDESLIQSAQLGDEKAFETLIEKYRVRVYATISTFIGNPQDREDIAQETLINAYRNLRQLSTPERFGYWLDTIAKNQCRDWLRKNRIRTVPIDEVEENLLKSDDSPEQNSVEAEQRRIIAQAIDTLPQTERHIARAHYLENASHDELVSRHGISYQSVSSRLFRAKRKLVKQLRRLLGGILIPPTPTLKKISSGGFTAMKIGTAPKITVGVIAIIALAFFGSRQLLSPEEGSSPSAEITASSPSQGEQSAPEINANRKNVVTAPSRTDEPQISIKEMEQIEDFFADLEAADAQSKTGQLAEAESRQDADEPVAGNANALTENAEQSAEEVMNAFVVAFRNLDAEGMRPLMTGDMNMEEYTSYTFDAETIEMRVEEQDGTEGAEHHVTDMANELLQQHKQRMLETIFEIINQAEIVNSGYVDDEFHFRLGMPPLPPPQIASTSESSTIETTVMATPDVLFKMRKENDVWRIYDSETLN